MLYMLYILCMTFFQSTRSSVPNNSNHDLLTDPQPTSTLPPTPSLSPSTSLTLPLTLSLTYSFSHAGKSKDTLELSELSAPLLDVVMSPGQILYVPAGFPHTTGTISMEFTKMSCTVCHRIKSVHSCGIF